MGSTLHISPQATVVPPPPAFAALAEATPAAVLVHRDFVPLYANGRALHLLGVPDLAALGGALLERLPPAQARWVQTLYRRGFATLTAPRRLRLSLDAEPAAGTALDVTATRIDWTDGPACLCTVAAAAAGAEACRTDAAPATAAGAPAQPDADVRLYRALMAQAGDGFFVTDAEGRLTLTTPGCEAATGYTEAELRGRHVRELVQPRRDDGPLALERLPEDTPAIVPLWVRRKDGRRYPTEVSLLRRPDGRVQGISRDITRRWRAESALRRSEEQYRQLVRGSLQGILILVDGRIRFANGRAAEIFGYPHEGTLQGHAMLELVAPAFHDKITGCLMGETPPERCEFQGRRRNTSHVWVEAQPTWIVWEGQPALLATLFDVTRRHEAEQERRRLVAALEQADELVLLLNAAGIIEYANPAFARVTGFAPREVIGRNPRMLRAGPEDIGTQKALWRAIRSGTAWAGTHRMRRRDGSLLETEATYSPVRGEAGELVGCIGVLRDVTRQRLLERRLHQSQKLQAVGQLAGGMAHQFNNLLQTIQGYTELAATQAPADSRQRAHLQRVLDAAGRAGELTRHLLAFTRRGRLQRTTTDVNALLEEMRVLIEPTLGRTIRLELALAGHLPCVQVDPLTIEQVVMNLVANARDAMPGGGTLRIATGLSSQPVPGAAPPASQPRVTLAVSDTGVGMPPEVLERVFEPFYSTKAPGEGPGLGLSTAYSAVEEHGGWMDAASTVGEGSRFTVYLPPAESAPTGH